MSCNDPLSDTKEVERRQGLVGEPHMYALEAYRRSILTAHAGAFVPCFDPCNGGIHAKLLILLEAPGGKARHFISQDNPDPTARNVKQFLTWAGIDRRDILIWNIVPWYVGTSTHIRSVKASDKYAALPLLPDLMKLLPQLKAVLLLGKHAWDAGEYISTFPNLQAFKTWHPSQRVFSIWPEKKYEVKEALAQVASLLKEPTKVPL